MSLESTCGSSGADTRLQPNDNVDGLWIVDVDVEVVAVPLIRSKSGSIVL